MDSQDLKQSHRNKCLPEESEEMGLSLIKSQKSAREIFVQALLLQLSVSQPAKLRVMFRCRDAGVQLMQVVQNFF